jgi:hypothetical protein
MVRLIAPNGATVNVSDDKAKRLLAGSGYKKPTARKSPEKTDGTSPHSTLKVADLKAEIARRNEGREPDALLSAEGTKPELVAVLDADDAATAGSGD